MGKSLDAVPFSGIIRIRDMMYSVKDPFRLDQGDVSFDAPDTVKAAMHRAIDENRSHYVQTTGVPDCSICSPTRCGGRTEFSTRDRTTRW